MPNGLILAPGLLQACFPDLLSICVWGSALGFHAAHNSAQTPQGTEHENFLEGLVFDMEDERLEELRWHPDFWTERQKVEQDHRKTNEECRFDTAIIKLHMG